MNRHAIPMAVMTRVVPAVVAVAAMGAFYLFLSTAGTMTTFPQAADAHYGQLAVAFVDGHTDLIQRPDGTISGDAALQERYWDLSLHDGRLYLYWGPVPALIGAVLLAGFSVHLTDEQLTFGFAVVRALFGALVLVRVKRVCFRGQPWWPTLLGIVTLVIGAPLTTLLARGVVYEASILGGQCFLVVGIYAALVALTGPSCEGSRGRVLLAAASCLWTLGFGCRLSQVLACAALAGLTFGARVAAGSSLRRGRAWVDRLQDGLALGVPMVAGIVLQALYNRNRFGSALDSGLDHQISTLDFHSAIRFVLPNLYTYVVKAPFVETHFPFVSTAHWDEYWLLGMLPYAPHGPSDTHFESNVGFLWSTPFYALSVVTACALGRWTLRAMVRRDFALVSPTPPLAWFATSSLALLVLGLLPCLVSFCSASRYLADGSSGLAFSAAVGLSLLVARPCRWSFARWILRAGATGAVLLSIFVNLALWVGGPYGDSLQTHNRPLFDKLSAAFDREPVPSPPH
jgi:hypothetical protein